MSKHVVTSTEANRHFSDLLNRVRYQGQSFDIKRGKEIVAKLVPVKPMILANEFATFLKNLPLLESGDAEIFKKSVAELRDNISIIKDLWD